MHLIYESYNVYLSVCLTGRAGRADIFNYWPLFSSANLKQGRAGQGRQTFSVTGRYLATPIRNKAGQGRAGRHFQLLAVI